MSDSASTESAAQRVLKAVESTQLQRLATTGPPVALRQETSFF